jgi:hypothetical protein
MTNSLDKSPLNSIVMPSPTSLPTGLQITQDVRMRVAQAETMARFHLAFTLPRNMLDVGAKLLAACENPDFAKVAVYRKPGSPPIEGLSVRFAELARQYLRNISTDCSPEMEDEFSVHYRYTVTDLESNTPESETFKVNKTVERRGVKEGDTVLSMRTNSNGERVYLIPATEDQMITKVNAQKSKVKRTLILALLPAEIRAQCLARCKEVAGSDDKKDPQTAVKGIVTAFLSIGIDVPDLKEYLGKSPQAAVDKDIEDLRGIYAMLRDGEVTWADVLEGKREADAKRGSKAEFVAQKQKEREKNRRGRGGAAAATPAATAAPKARGARGGNAEGGTAQGSGGGAAATSKTAGKTEEAPKPTRASRRDEDDDGDENPPSSNSPDSSTPAT